MAPSRILILGGTAEARRLAEQLHADPAFEPITSLAGRTRDPAIPSGEVRVGGFGGAGGLARFLSDRSIDALIDASHPFAEQISRNAAEASRVSGVPRLRLERPAWRPRSDDRWIEMADAKAAAAGLAEFGRRVFLSIGRQDLALFRRLRGIWFLLRMIDPPSAPLPLADYEIVLDRGPFDADAEERLLSAHRVEAIVSRNSGGSATYGKIAAARRLGLPVIMLRRPSPPPGDRVESVDAAIGWLIKG